MPGFVLARTLWYGHCAADSVPMELSIGGFEADPATGKVSYRVKLTGPMPVDKTMHGRDHFDAARMGMAGLRQILRMLQQRDPAMKYFEDIEGKRVEQSVDDIFWTHDCVPER